MDPRRDATPNEIRAAVCIAGVALAVIVGLAAIGAQSGREKASGVPGQGEVAGADPLARSAERPG